MESKITDTEFILFVIGMYIIQIPLIAYLIKIKSTKLSLDINFKALIKPSFFGNLFGLIFDVAIEFSPISDISEDNGIVFYAVNISQIIISIILTYLGFKWYIAKYSTGLINLTNKEFRKELIYSIIKASLIALFLTVLLYVIIKI